MHEEYTTELGSSRDTKLDTYYNAALAGGFQPLHFFGAHVAELAFSNDVGSEDLDTEASAQGDAQ